MALALNYSQSSQSQIFADSPINQSLRSIDNYEKYSGKEHEIFNIGKTLLHFMFKVFCLIVIRYFFFDFLKKVCSLRGVYIVRSLPLSNMWFQASYERTDTAVWYTTFHFSRRVDSTSVACRLRSWKHVLFASTVAVAINSLSRMLLTLYRQLVCVGWFGNGQPYTGIAVGCRRISIVESAWASSKKVYYFSMARCMGPF